MTFWGLIIILIGIIKIALGVFVLDIKLPTEAIKLGLSEKSCIKFSLVIITDALISIIFVLYYLL